MRVKMTPVQFTVCLEAMPPPTRAEWWEMSFQPSLFGGEPTFDRQALATKLKRLSERNVFIGTSSWRYEGWLNQVYTPERYQTRGRFSKQKFHDECIQEYAETFPVVGADFSFYAIPEPPFWKKVFDADPQSLAGSNGKATYTAWPPKARVEYPFDERVVHPKCTAFYK
jgi:hypothetical protein